MENSITTFSELRTSLGTDGQASSTECGWIRFDGKKVYVYRHWSYSGGYPVYMDEKCLYPIGELVTGEWFPYIIDGVQQKDFHGLVNAYDCSIILKKQYENLELFIEKYWDDSCILYSTPTDETDKRLNLFLDSEKIQNPFENLKFLRDYAYNYKCMICKKWINENYEN